MLYLGMMTLAFQLYSISGMPFLFWCMIWWMLVFVHAQTPVGAPLVIPPSGQWDGANGPWSTFNLGIGNPVQPFRCVPGIADNMVRVPLRTEACDDKSPTESCDRRPTFNYTASSTWEMVGYYALWPEWDVEYANKARNSLLGLDNVIFGHDAIRELGLTRQYVGIVNFETFTVCVVGIAMGSTKVSSFDDRMTRPNLLSNLCAMQAVPSCSYSYTAGSARKNTTGSLVFGGYDTSRFDAKTSLSVPMRQENATLQVHLQSIQIQIQPPGWQNEPFKSSGPPTKSTLFRIESFFSEIWLPTEMCTLFEETFGLVWDETTNYYLLNDTTRTALLAMDPVVKFYLSADELPSSDASNVKSFTLPYSAFDLQLSPPILNTTRYYFPLKRAKDPSQYILGRVFLQETYITVDYRRANFSISQAYGTGGSGYVVPINNATSAGQEALKNGARSGGTWAGIGAGAAVLVSVAVLFVYWRRRWLPKRAGLTGRKTPSTMNSDGKPELEGEGLPRYEADGQARSELAADKKEFELEVKEIRELETVEKYEVDATHSPTVAGLDQVHEMSAESISRQTSGAKGSTIR